ncbi:polyprotein [Plakobranchus ocellatus]|uniref:Polyprotein n=1 Tax=Plakobranchus ocellatus TaxID=259542 RepID=A0AAV4CBW9_9GAST|nr:polyprotein [Plakobranchus ocellatus]
MVVVYNMVLNQSAHQYVGSKAAEFIFRASRETFLAYGMTFGMAWEVNDHKDVAMYCQKAKLKLPMKSILEEYKCGKARLLTMLEESDDPVVKNVLPFLKSGRKWKVTEAVDEALY